MNKKYIYLIFLLACLMISISFMGKIFVKDIRKVALSNNYVSTFNKYLLREEYEISIPSEWEVKEKPGKDEKEFELEFKAKNIEGSFFILNGEIEEVLDEAYSFYKEKSQGSFEIDKWNQVTAVEDNKENKYYFKQYSEGKVSIVKYSYKKGKIKDSMNVVFDEIINSIK